MPNINEAITSSRTVHVFATSADLDFLALKGAPTQAVVNVSSSPCTLVLTCAKPFPGTTTETITLQPGQQLPAQFVALTASGSSGTFAACWG